MRPRHISAQMVRFHIDAKGFKSTDPSRISAQPAGLSVETTCTERFGSKKIECKSAHGGPPARHEHVESMLAIACHVGASDSY